MLILVFSVAEVFAEVDVPDYTINKTGYEEALNRLATSAQWQDRVQAAEVIGLKVEDSSHLAIFWKLLEDSDKRVRGRAFLAVKEVSGSKYLPEKDARKLASTIRKEIDRERAAILKRKGSSEEDVFLFACQCLALNSLYYLHPYTSRKDYAAWQDQTMYQTFIELLSTITTHNTDSNDVFLGILLSIDDPFSALNALEAVSEEIEQFPPKRVLATLDLLWRHHLLFGFSKPMHDQYIKLLLPHVANLRAHALSALTNQFERQQLEFNLNQIDHTEGGKLPKSK